MAKHTAQKTRKGKKMASTINNSDFQAIGEICENSSVFEQPPEPPKCKYCGKEYILQEYTVKGMNRPFKAYCVPCNCLNEAEKKKKEEERKARLRERYQKANIGKRYIDITLEKLAEMGTEHIEDAQKYCKNFNPEGGASVHMIGDFGNGKTSVGYGILKKLLQKGFNGIHLTWIDVVNRYYYAKSFTSEEKVDRILYDLSCFDVVVLDEFVLNTKDEKEINFATELFDRWYKDNKCFVLINNPCDIIEMKKIPRLGKLLDRVREQADLWRFEHGSYRREKKGV